jgi:hypothetical protein
MPAEERMIQSRGLLICQQLWRPISRLPFDRPESGIFCFSETRWLSGCLRTSWDPAALDPTALVLYLQNSVVVSGQVCKDG